MHHGGTKNGAQDSADSDRDANSYIYLSREAKRHSSRRSDEDDGRQRCGMRLVAPHADGDEQWHEDDPATDTETAS